LAFDHSLVSASSRLAALVRLGSELKVTLTVISKLLRLLLRAVEEQNAANERIKLTTRLASLAPLTVGISPELFVEKVDDGFLCGSTSLRAPQNREERLVGAELSLTLFLPCFNSLQRGTQARYQLGMLLSTLLLPRLCKRLDPFARKELPSVPREGHRGFVAGDEWVGSYHRSLDVSQKGYSEEESVRGERADPLRVASVKCEYADAGCEWKGALSDVPAHLASLVCFRHTPIPL